MDNLKLDYKEILTRDPYFEILPSSFRTNRTIGPKRGRLVQRGQKVVEPVDRPVMRVLTQADFLRMYYPSGHAINDPVLYPDVKRVDPESKKEYIQPIVRTAFAFQQVIATKQRVHITGNDMQFELSGRVGSDEEELEKLKYFNIFRQGWLDMNMEYNFYEFTEYKIVGDAAVVGYFDEDGHAHARTLSYLKGDTLYPHRNSLTGKMELFARKYADYDEEGRYSTEFVEIWDDKYLYRAKRGLSKSTIVQKIKDFFGLSGYEIIYQKEHGFDRCPVAYYREESGPCFLPAQSTIET